MNTLIRQELAAKMEKKIKTDTIAQGINVCLQQKYIQEQSVHGMLAK